MLNCTHPVKLRSRDWPSHVDGDPITIEQEGVLIRLVFSIWGNQHVPEYKEALRIARLDPRKAKRLKLEMLIPLAEKLTRQRSPIEDYERESVFEKSGGRCSYCGASLEASFEVDHAVPVSRGGRNVIANYRASCQPCNSRKRTMTEAEFRNLLEAETTNV